MHIHPQSPYKCISKTKDQSSFATPSSTSTSNKIGSRLHYHSSSTDSSDSMTPLDTLLYGSFTDHGSTGMGHGSITPATSIAGSQRVTSSMWQLPGPFSPALLPAMDTLSAEQAAEIYQLATKCQALDPELAKQFQNLSGLEAMHQAMAHETINVGHMAHNAAFSMITANQPDRDCEKFLCQFHAEADQAWKDMNDIIFSHQLRYDSQLVAFISTAEGTLQAKWDEIWSHILSLTEVACLPHVACPTLASQILDKLPTLPLDLSYHTAISRMLACCPESYAFQAWSITGDRDYLLDYNIQATSLLTWKLAHVGSAMLGSPLQQMERKGAGLDPTPHPASFLRRASQNPTLPLTLKMAVVGAWCLKMAASLRERVRQAPMKEPLTVAAVQMVKALTAVGPAVKK